MLSVSSRYSNELTIRILIPLYRNYMYKLQHTKSRNWREPFNNALYLDHKMNWTIRGRHKTEALAC